MRQGEERTLFQNNNILITDKRAVVDDTTYALHNITSVRTINLGADRRSGLGLIMLGSLPFLVAMALLVNALILRHDFRLLFIIAGIGLVVLAGLLFVGGLALAVASKNLYAVIIGTSGVERQAVTSTDWQTIREIVNALNDALAMHT